MTNRLRFIALLLAVSASGGAGVATSATAQKGPESAAVIPFELVNRHILIRVTINDSAPLWFIFDTGDKVAIVDTGRAKSLGLNLHGEINVGGAGAGTLKGSFVRDASLKVIGAETKPQPVLMSIPLNPIGRKLGHDTDGIIGADFIKQFVVEVDYPGRVLRLYDKETFVYSGSGAVIPTTLNGAGHPIIPAEFTLAGRSPIKGKVVIDVGSGGSLILHRPFVEQEHLPAAGQKTIRLIGAGGAGGKTAGRIGRIEALRIGGFQIDNPLTVFTEDRGGAFTNCEVNGNIGERILSKFKVLLDYSHNRIILEPNATVKDLIGPASSGLSLVAEGADYKSFRVEEVLEDSPAAEAGLKPDDVIMGIDDRPAAALSLSIVNETLEKPQPHKLSVRRGERTLQITLTPKRLV